MLYVGCHLSASDGNLEMVKTAMSIGANTFAFFTRNPRGSQAKKLDMLEPLPQKIETPVLGAPDQKDRP